jgi:pimeloyl-ACP methyl ester carboxylesterase
VKEIALSDGTLEHEDTGEGRVLVLLHGLVMDGSLWDATAANLSADHHCVVPTLPAGLHPC